MSHVPGQMYKCATERDDDRYVIIPATGSIRRNNRITSFQIISAKLKCSVKCGANSIVISCMNVLDKKFMKTCIFLGNLKENIV